MNELPLPLLELSILLPFLGGLIVARVKDPDRARRWSLMISGSTLLCTLIVWGNFLSLHTFSAHNAMDLIQKWIHPDLLVIDELSAPLLPLSALLFFLTILATLRTKIRRFSFVNALLMESLLLLTLSSCLPWVIVLTMVAATLLPYVELKQRGKSTRVYLWHMLLFAGLLVVGQALVSMTPRGSTAATGGILLLTLAVLARNGVIPLHCWLTDLFEKASLGTSLLFVAPMVGAYATMRLVLPVAPAWILQMISILSLITAVYAAGMTLVQQDSRRFFCYLFLSNSSLMLVGLEIATPIGLTGALCIWFSIGLSLAGFGLTLRSVEARTGRLSLETYQGLFEKMPLLAGFFLLTGMASIGFPGTIGFIGTELLVDGAGQISPGIEMLVVLTTALNSLAVLQAYFKIFTGKQSTTTIDLRCRRSERIAVLLLSVLILGGGIYPQPGIASRYHAAIALLNQRTQALSLPASDSHSTGSHTTSTLVP